MIIKKFDEVKVEIIKHLKAKRLFPILGSGFTTKCAAKNGNVPTGEKMKNHMISAIQNEIGTDEDIENKAFSKIATYYHDIEDERKQKKYLRDNFTSVILEENRKKILDIDWLYIYTLNLDDGIENNSKYKYVITSNHNVDFEALENENCVIKLHGDVHEHLKYHDCDSKIFDFDQYSKSIQKNKSLLNKLSHDLTYTNVIFVGCSLDDEMDLKSITSFTEDSHSSSNSKYYMTVNEPSKLKQIELKSYGITHVILNDSYDSIYTNIHDAYVESQKTSTDELDKYKNIPVKHVDKDFIKNKDYLYFGKNLMDIQKGQLNIPAFFIHRGLTHKIMDELDNSPVHLVYGPRVSGKTYLMVSLALKVRDRDVYYFDSRNTLNHDAIHKILNVENTLILFDCKSINKDSIYDILRNTSSVAHKNNKVVIAINTSDKDIVSAINNSTVDENVTIHELGSKLSETECSDINKSLSVVELPKYNPKKSIIDNLVKMQKENEQRGNYISKVPSMNTVEEVAVLILYAVQEKLYTKDLINNNIIAENYEQLRKTEPLISEEHTLFFERSVYNTSTNKYILHAKFWLYENLGKFAENKKNRDIIVNAYIYIISNLVQIDDGNPYSLSMDYIKFDVINEIFKSGYRGQIGLAKAIYEGLNEQLSTSAHYFHQRAKCYLWQSNNDATGVKDLEEALRFALLSKQYIEVELEKKFNQKLEISLGHVEVTVAFIYSKLSNLCRPTDPKRLNDAIESVFCAITRQSNDKEFAYIYKNNSNNDVKKMIQMVPSTSQLLTPKSKDRYSKIFDLLRSYQS